MGQQWPVIHVPLPTEIVFFVECFLLEQGAMSIDVTHAKDELKPIQEPQTCLESYSTLRATLPPRHLLRISDSHSNGFCLNVYFKKVIPASFKKNNG